MSNKPTHNLCLAIGEAKNTRWHRVAGLWQTKDGDGYTGEIPTGLSITGRIGIFPAKTDDNGGAQ